ncbi:unnamed protein product [Coccothraustes coccothraustes]
MAPPYAVQHGGLRDRPFAAISVSRGARTPAAAVMGVARYRTGSAGARARPGGFAPHCARAGPRNRRRRARERRAGGDDGGERSSAAELPFSNWEQIPFNLSLLWDPSKTSC